MAKQNTRQRRAGRKAKKEQYLRKKLSRLKHIFQKADDCPDFDQFLGSLDLSGLSRLIGIFSCTPDEYGATEAVLARDGHPGYEVLQWEVNGEKGDERDPEGPRAWTAAVKRAGQSDEAYRIFVGIVRRPATGDGAKDAIARWGEIVSAVHELGHAHDLQDGAMLASDGVMDIAQAELRAHKFACRFFRDHRMMMALTVYLATVVSPIADESGAAVPLAASEFMASSEYAKCLKRIPKYLQRQFDVGGESEEKSQD